jgi:hypothetical protein
MCYIVPTVAALTTTFVWKKQGGLKLWGLLLLFYGASIFGIIDHLWNGELFLASREWLKDLGLGVAITVAIFLAWGLISALSKKSRALHTYPSAS